MRITILIFFIVCGMSVSLYNHPNDPPQVKITKPVHRDTFQWSSLVTYDISVTDTEDGSSEYNEIVPEEVFLMVRFLPDSSRLSSYLSGQLDPQPPGLQLMKQTGCFNCHAKKSKLIGPSFEAISDRYTDTVAASKNLALKLLKGSQGVWGEEKMPPNPQLSEEQAGKIIAWILRNGADKQVNLLPKLRGAFETAAKPPQDPGRAVYVLTASYLDHGSPGDGSRKKAATHSVVLRSGE